VREWGGSAYQRRRRWERWRGLSGPGDRDKEEQLMSEGTKPETRDEEVRAQDAVDVTARDDETLLERLGYRQELNRALGLFASFALQFSLISVGGAVFLTFGYGLTVSGPAFFWAWVVGGLLQMAVALSVAECASAFPLAASAFSWVRRLWGNSLAWMVGYILFVAHIAAMASLNFGISPYLLNFLGLAAPSVVQITLAAIALVVVQTLLNVVSVKLSAVINNIGVTAELIGMAGVAAVLVILGLRQGPGVLTDTAGTAAASGGYLLPFLLALLVPAFVISSFDATCNVGEEMHDAARNVPKGSMIACVSAYLYGIVIIAVPLMATANIAAAMDAPLPLLYIFQERLGAVGTTIALSVLITGLFACSMMLQVTGTRMIWGQARDGALPAAGWLHRLNVGRVPANATVVSGVIAVIFLLWSHALEILTALTALAWAAAYGLTVAVILYGKLKGRVPQDRGWNLGKWGVANDIVAVVWSVVLVVAMSISDVTNVLGGFLAVVGIGLVIYYGFVRRTWSPEPLPQMRVSETEDAGGRRVSA